MVFCFQKVVGRKPPVDDRLQGLKGILPSLGFLPLPEDPL
jgi:hypothetical protein